MRVLHFFKTYWPDTFGGVERTIDSIAGFTARHGVQSTILSLSDDIRRSPEEWQGQRLIKAPLDLEIASTGISRAALSILREEAGKADIVHYHFPWPFMDLAHFAARIDRPSIVTYHSDIVKQRFLKHLYAPLMHLFLNRVDRIVATSPDYAATSPVLSRYAEKVDIIPIGLEDGTQFHDAARVARWQARFPRPFFIFTGVLRYYKGLNYLIDAAASVNADILVVGSGPLSDELRVAAASLPNVHFLGQLEDQDKFALLHLASGFVFPSHLRSEAFGLALVEGAMFGKPLISTSIGSGMSYINRNGETGIEVPPRSAIALADAMNTILSAPDRANAMGAAARRRYLELFTADRMAAGYVRAYQKLLG
ncbi:glycosyl transferase family 1 [Aureimonas altamirensis]|uniref:Glycosyl transferase family 1 n=1 Tax=Aureimonas altamirensis TaxID=370622 RepID=A0A0B1Q5K2_9HYPH|nr:glycosyltransferase [Aureimonas altamirensis]KHJ54120.1 glycosyl transferase family 1 [Aureimonas altamirensis]